MEGGRRQGTNPRRSVESIISEDADDMNLTGFF